MKNIFLAALTVTGLFVASCNGKQADQENADSTMTYTDTNKVDTVTRDTAKGQMLADSISNTPADAKH
ncbi:hypothetical protein [Pedobacter sp. CFBP9032]|uniref:hypothetical protein n=1 Tax=Pedobacter sp. CFBP9032 TaxID=3096539 RepID=UPI002A6AD6CC|nr:hypothetical protein [Pedobacter sp. CFBP9032]MDY0905748.1 hypothetical protein [Pedobacter sp. CFBP9032]